MNVGVIHYNLDLFNFEEFLDYARDAGFQTVELQIGDIWSTEHTDPEARAVQVREAVRARGLSVSALASGNDFVVLDEESIAHQVARMRRILHLATLLDCPVIRTEGGQPKDSVPEERWVEAMAGCLKRLVADAEALNLRFAVDNHGYCTNDGDRQLALIEAVGSDRVGVNLDTMNYRWFGHDIAAINRFYEILAPHTFHTHFKDGFGSRESYRGAVLGEGEIDLAHAVACLKKVGYQGVWCVEYEGPKPTDVGYRRCGEWIRANV